jgi:hypothetical protein
MCYPQPHTNAEYQVTGNKSHVTNYDKEKQNTALEDLEKCELATWWDASYCSASNTPSNIEFG